MEQTILFKTNSDTILEYTLIEYGKYCSSDSNQIFASYQPVESTEFEKLKFPPDGKVVWEKNNGRVSYKKGIYYGIYDNGLVKGIYDAEKNTIINLVRDQSHYFNICVGVIDYLFAKALFRHNIFRVHAAGVSKGNNVLLICGAKGVGKTTLLMKFLRNGYSFVADDSIFVQFLDNELICYPFPKTIKINLGDINKFQKIYQNLTFKTILTSDGTKRAVINPQENKIPIRTQKSKITQIIVPSLSKTTDSKDDIIQPSDPSSEFCVVDVLKRKFSFDLLKPSFRGEGLLNIDYIEDPEITAKQDQLCKQTLQNYELKFFKIGPDIEDINIEDYFPLSNVI